MVLLKWLCLPRTRTSTSYLLGQRLNYIHIYRLTTTAFNAAIWIYNGKLTHMFYFPRSLHSNLFISNTNKPSSNNNKKPKDASSTAGVTKTGATPAGADASAGSSTTTAATAVAVPGSDAAGHEDDEEDDDDDGGDSARAGGCPNAPREEDTIVVTDPAATPPSIAALDIHAKYDHSDAATWAAYLSRAAETEAYLKALDKATPKAAPLPLPDDVQYVRPFLSSTFRDFNNERDIVFKSAFAEVEKLTVERGLFFAPLDLRWGITNEQYVKTIYLNTRQEVLY